MVLAAPHCRKLKRSEAYYILRMACSVNVRASLMVFANFMDLFLIFIRFIECSGFLSPFSSRVVPFLCLVGPICLVYTHVLVRIEGIVSC